MTENENKPNFWTTLPGILTGIVAVLTAVDALCHGLSGRTTQSANTNA